VPAESGDTPKEDIVKLKSDIERSPIKRGIKARILRVLDDKAVTDTKKDELVNKYIGSLKAIIRDEANTLGDRRSAIRALQETMVTGRLQTVENTQLTKYCERAEVAIKALESTLERARVNSEALAQKIESLFKDETTLDGRRTALRSLMSDERISPFMKNDIDTMLPE
jgi:5-methylcytosine-specific restriction endonuclease McrBC regulatory subunit McrC